MVLLIRHYTDTASAELWTLGLTSLVGHHSCTSAISSVVLGPYWSGALFDSASWVLVIMEFGFVSNQVVKELETIGNWKVQQQCSYTISICYTSYNA